MAGGLKDLLGATGPTSTEEEPADPLAEDPEEYEAELREELETAFPEMKGKPERIDALKRAIKLCM